MRAPVNIVPVPDDGQDEEHYRNQQQAGGFQRVDGMLVPVAFVLSLQGCHEDIVAPQGAKPHS